MKNKTAEEMTRAFAKMEITPRVVYHDQGSEYRGAFNTYCEEHNIINTTNYKDDHHALGIIDRFSKTYKTMVQRYLTAKNTNTYINKVYEFVQLYNNTPHSSIDDIKPVDAINNQQNIEAIKNINHKKQLWNNRVSKSITHNVAVGNHVRIQNKKTPFSKGYEVSYSDDAYQVVSISGNRATLDNGKEVPIKLLQVVPAGTTTNNSAAVEANLHNKIKRIYRKEGLTEENIINTRRQKKESIVKKLLREKLI